MDEIIIEKLRLKGKHGCFAKERDEYRAFEVSMRLFLSLNKAAKTDELEDTIDYPAAMAIAEGVLMGESVRLIEKLADMPMFSGDAAYSVQAVQYLPAFMKAAKALGGRL